MCQNLWSFYRSTPLGGEDSPNFRQLLYCSTVLLVEALYEHMKKIDPTSLNASVQGNFLEQINAGMLRDFIVLNVIFRRKNSFNTRSRLSIKYEQGLRRYYFQNT